MKYTAIIKLLKTKYNSLHLRHVFIQLLLVGDKHSVDGYSVNLYFVAAMV